MHKIRVNVTGVNILINKYLFILKMHKIISKEYIHAYVHCAVLIIAKLIETTHVGSDTNKPKLKN